MEHEALIRLAVDARSPPRRSRAAARGRRRATNLGFLIADTLRLIAAPPPPLAVGAALDAEARGWGLFNLPGRPGWSLFPFRGP